MDSPHEVIWNFNDNSTVYYVVLTCRVYGNLGFRKLKFQLYTVNVGNLRNNLFSSLYSFVRIIEGVKTLSFFVSFHFCMSAQRTVENLYLMHISEFFNAKNSFQI